ncbi:MAG: hypothetical protein IKR13_00980, partial [Victivallales bacterium]|nr:hypothetical protein [Victivallales bacterium]
MPRRPFPQNIETPLAVRVVALGCAKNLVDAEVMCGTLAANGLCLTTEPEAADLTVINTCGFIQSARDEAEAAIEEAIRWKQSGRRKGLVRRIIVGGCLAQRSAPEYAKRYPQVDCFIGIDSAPHLHEVVHTLISHAPTEQPLVLVGPEAPQWLY